MKYVRKIDVQYGKVTPEDFRKYIIKNTTIDGDTGCWNWNKGKNQKGYGSMRFLGAKAPSHRVSYMAFKDNTFQVLDNIEELVCHKCDNTSCCNPNHLYVGTQRDNMKDRFLKENGRLRSLRIRESNRLSARIR